MNKKYKIVTATLMAFILLFCGCQKHYSPDEVKVIATENLELFKEAADLAISKNLSLIITNYELHEIDGLTEAELEIFKKCQKLGVKELYYEDRLYDYGKEKYPDDHYYVTFEIYYDSMLQEILYIPPHSDFETPVEAILKINPYIEESDIEEIFELDENWYYFRSYWVSPAG